MKSIQDTFYLCYFICLILAKTSFRISLKMVNRVDNEIIYSIMTTCDRVHSNALFTCVPSFQYVVLLFVHKRNDFNIVNLESVRIGAS